MNYPKDRTPAREVMLRLQEEEVIMPDGRPLFAWKNEIAMLRDDAERVERDRVEVDSLMRILRIVEIEEQKEPHKGDYVIRVRMADIVTANSAEDALKHAEIKRA